MRIRPAIFIAALAGAALLTAGAADARGTGGGRSSRQQQQQQQQQQTKNPTPGDVPDDLKNCQLFSVGTYDLVPDGNGHLAINMAINGKPVKMIVDTAGYISALTPHTIAANNLISTHVGVAMEYDDQGNELTDLVTPDTVGIGVFTLPNIDMLVLKSEYTDASVDGAVAWDMLGQFDLDLDFPNKTLKVFGQVHCPGQVVYWRLGHYTKIPFRLDDQNHIRFDVVLDGKTVDTEIDTGHPTMNMRDSIAFQMFSIHDGDPKIRDTDLVNPDGSKTPMHAYQFKSLTVGNVEISNPLINIVPDNATKTYLKNGGPRFSSSMRPPPLTIGLTRLQQLFDHIYIAFKEHTFYATVAPGTTIVTQTAETAQTN